MEKYFLSGPLNFSAATLNAESVIPVPIAYVVSLVICKSPLPLSLTVILYLSLSPHLQSLQIWNSDYIFLSLQSQLTVSSHAWITHPCPPSDCLALVCVGTAKIVTTDFLSQWRHCSLSSHHLFWCDLKCTHRLIPNWQVWRWKALWRNGPASKKCPVVKLQQLVQYMEPLEWELAKTCISLKLIVLKA